VQGSIERSNVSGVTEMAQMIRVERAYQQIADMMQRQDDIRSSAIQKLGSLAA
jgi:flagellar basal-body rod protein FlgF